MKNRIFKAVFALVLTFMAQSVFAQDAFVVFFNDGTFRKFYLRDIVEISTSQYDENGTAHGDYQYQHITTKSGSFVYSLSNIDCIAFSKNEEAQAEENFAETMPEVVSVLSGCENISQAEAQVEQIKEMEGVEDAWSDGHQLYVKIEDCATFNFHFSHQIPDVGIGYEDYQDLAKEMFSKVKKAQVAGSSNLKVAIVDQEYKDEKMAQYRILYHDPLINALKECGIQPDYVKNPQVDFFYDNSSDPENLHFYDYDVVLLFTHGLYFQPAHLLEKKWWQVMSEDKFELYNQKLHGMLASDEIMVIPEKIQQNEPLWRDYYSKFKSWKNDSKYKDIPEDCINFSFHEEKRYGEKYWILYPILSELFFRDYATGKFNDNSVLFISACKSLKGEGQPSFSFADILFGKNLATYIGYTESDGFGYWVLPKLFNDILKSGWSLGKAYDNLPEHQRNETIFNFYNSGLYTQKDITKFLLNGSPCNAELKILPESEEARGRFFLGVYTSEADQSKINQEYSHNQTVTLEGITYHLDETVEDLHYGFKYKEVDIGHDPLDSWNPVELWKEEPSIGAELVPMTISSDKGNRLFKATLTGIEQGKTYVYRAFTYDGINYNYGETCSFKIDPAPVLNDLQLSSTELSLVKGNSGTVEITSGNDSYTVESSDPSVATATLTGNTITIEALKAGQTTITVTDTQSSQTATIAVTVKEGGSFLEGQIVMTRKLLVHHGGSYNYPEISFGFDNGKLLTLGYYNTGYWMDSYNNSQSGIHIISANTMEHGPFWGVGNPNAQTKDWSISPVILDEWFTEKLIINANGHIQYYLNNKYMGEEVFDDLNLGEASSFQLKIQPYGWWTGHYTYMDDFYLSTPVVTYSDNFNDGIIDLNIWKEPINPDGLREEDGIIKMEQLRTDQDFNLYIENVPLKSGGDIPVYTSCPDSHHPHMIDLGLPSGTKWACCNVGAEKPEDYGGYFSWGETTEKSSYTSDNYLDGKGTSYDIGNDIAGTQYDAATVNWGSSWVMPSFEQVEELRNNCTSKLTKENGVTGCRFTGPNGASIFLPPPGYRSGDGLYRKGVRAHYWSSSLYKLNSLNAYILYFDSSQLDWDYTDNRSRSSGRSVRPVSKN